MVTKFDPAKHPRGHHTNEGSFSEKVNTDPEAALEPPTVDEPQVTYSIPTGKLDALRERLDKANRRLERAGIEDRFSYVATPRVLFNHETGQRYETNDVTLSRPVIAYNGWAFDSVHEMTPAGTTISHYQGDNSERTPIEDMRCDQCGANRRREKVFRVVNTDGETKQVGSTCLHVFLGVKPEGLWTLTDDFEMDDLTAEDDDFGAFGGGGSQVIPADDLLVATLRASAETGFISKSAAGDYETPTAEIVLDDLRNLTANPTKAELKRAKAILKYVKGMEDDGSSDYVTNLKAALTPSADGGLYVNRKHVALVASAVGSYENHLRWERERKAREKFNATKKQAFLAAPKEKLKNVEATVVGFRQGADYGYGPSYHVTMMDDDGHVIYWKASNPPSLFEGNRVAIKSGTVKDNKVSDYNGDWETIITRARLEFVGENKTNDPNYVGNQ